MPPPLWKVSEIFYSIQGEGRHTGMPAVFLRMAGCSMGCDWCDTKYAFGAGQEMNNLQVLVELAKFPCKTVIITGGEPAEQDLPTLISLLKSAENSLKSIRLYGTGCLVSGNMISSFFAKYG